MVLYQKKKRVKPFLDLDEKTLLYGSFRPVNGQSINNKGKRQIPEPCGPPKPSGMALAFAFLLSFLKLLGGKAPVYSLSLSSFPNVVVGNLLFVVAVILESRSPGSVVIKQGLDSGTLRADKPPRMPSFFIKLSFPKEWPPARVRPAGFGDDSGNGYGKCGPYGTTLFFFIKNVTPRHKFVK